MYHPVKAKKYFGQHFLTDNNIALKIVTSLQDKNNVLEIGPGTGILTKYLFNIPDINLKLVEIDKESIEYLLKIYPELKGKIISADFMQYDIKTLFNSTFNIIGNFPYNISSQILFKILENRDIVNEVVGMFQKEVAVRISSDCGNKNYGILSVLLQAFYNIEYLFTVNEQVFTPHPKVKSAVIRMVRNNVKSLECDEKIFFSIVKTAFNQRRKILKNALSSFKFSVTENISVLNNENILIGLLLKRAEQLNVDEFVFLAKNVTLKEITQ